MGLRRRGVLAGGLGLAAQACSPGGAGSGGAGSGGGAGDPVRFSILSTENAAAQGVKWLPFLNDIGKAIGREIKPFFAASYTPLIEAMRFGQTELGWFSNQPGLAAVRQAGGEVFAHTTHPNGVNGYHSIIIVRRGGGLTLDRLMACDKSLSFGMGDVKSTSGTLAPMTYLFKPKSIDPNTCFKIVRTGSHQNNLFAVANGLLDASTNNSVGLDFARVGSDNAKAAYSKLDVIWTSPPLPESAIVARKDLDPALRAKIADFFIHYGSAPGAEGERQKAVMAKLHYTAFHPADDSYLQPVRDMRAASTPATQGG